MTGDTVPTIRPLLSRAASARPTAVPFDLTTVPDDPRALFRAWLAEAVDGGVRQPEAMTLSTVSAEGHPVGRTLLLKELDDDFWFATSSSSPKGRQLDANPRVALTFYWREQGRQIRVDGHAVVGPREAGVRDFVARHPDSRAIAVAMPQSAPIVDAARAREKVERARHAVDDDPEFTPDDWTAYRVVPDSLEFWQATTGRDQVRLRYDRGEAGDWWRTELWP